MGLPYTDRDWFIFIRDPDSPYEKYSHVVIRGPVPTQVLQEKLQRILNDRPLETMALVFESIRIIIFQQALNVEQLTALQGDFV